LHHIIFLIDEDLDHFNFFSDVDIESSE